MSNWLRLLMLLVVVAIGAIAFVQFRDTLTLETLARHEQALKRHTAEAPALVYGAAFGIYVAVTGLSLPGAAVMSVAYGWFFGFWRGLMLVNLAATTGATIAFLISRYLLRDVVQRRFGERLARFNEAFAKEGAFYLFALRLTPAAPFFVINLVMGLTPIRTWTFWWVSQLGMLPGGCVFVYAGASVPNLHTLTEKGVGSILTPQLAIAFVFLGLTPLVLKKLLARWRSKPSTA
jgi:uncharacterized membrane protein YdjX (TVP38/TMEM64 family)